MPEDIDDRILFDSKLLSSTESLANLMEGLSSDSDLSDLEFEGLKQKEPKKPHLNEFSFYNVDAQQELRKFCHMYQIPFLETNLPKTTRNAASIYGRMVEAGEKIHPDFEGKQIEKYLQIKVAQMQEEFTSKKNLTVKEKWKKFFIAGWQKVQVDPERAVKNSVVIGFREFVSDNFESLTDKQRLRILYSMSDEFQMKDMNTKFQILAAIEERMQNNRLDLRDGHLLLLLNNYLTDVMNELILRGRYG